MGLKVKPFSYLYAILILGKLHCRGIYLYPAIIFLFFLKVFSYIWHTNI